MCAWWLPPRLTTPRQACRWTRPRVIPVDARCPVCGMFPARSPDWAAQVIFSNGDAQFFDSPLSLFSYLQDVGRYTRGRDAGQIVARYVSDADSGRWIDARSAMYVDGSAARGRCAAAICRHLPMLTPLSVLQARAAESCCTPRISRLRCCKALLAHRHTGIELPWPSANVHETVLPAF